MKTTYSFFHNDPLFPVSLELRNTSADIDREANVRRNLLLTLLVFIMLSFFVGDLDKKERYDMKISFLIEITNLARLNPENPADVYCCCATLSICTS